MPSNEPTNETTSTQPSIKQSRYQRNYTSMPTHISTKHTNYQWGPAAGGEALRIRPISQRLTQAVLKTCQNPPESGSDKTPYPSQHPPALCRRARASRPLASIFRPFFQTLILILNLSSRAVPLEALGATLAPKVSPEAPT